MIMKTRALRVLRQRCLVWDCHLRIWCFQELFGPIMLYKEYFDYFQKIVLNHERTIKETSLHTQIPE